MDESTYHKLVAQAFRRIDDALADVDPDLVELSSTGDVVTLAFPGGVRCVVNTQRPVRQIWMAARANAWHFSYDEASGAWLDDKGRGELFAILASVIAEQTGLTIKL